MLNYIVVFNNRMYQVIDATSNNVVASFSNEIDALLFRKSLVSGSVSEEKNHFVSKRSFNLFDEEIYEPRRQRPIRSNNNDMNLLNIEDPTITYEKPIPEKVVNQEYENSDDFKIKFKIFLNLKKALAFVGNPKNLFEKEMSPTEKVDFIKNYNELASQINSLVVELGLDGGEMVEQISSDYFSNADEQRYHQKQLERTLDDLEESFSDLPQETNTKGTQNQKNFEFDDENLYVNDDFFRQDFRGAVVKTPNEYYTNNFDDTSLGETSAYNGLQVDTNAVIDEVYNAKKYTRQDEENVRQEQKLKDAFSLNNQKQVMNYNKPTEKAYNNEMRSSRGMTDDYVNDLVNSDLNVGKTKDIIDLGPINEDDDIFSTPRRDNKNADDFETFVSDSENLSKKQLKQLKKIAKKRK